MSYSVIATTQTGGVLTIALNRPDKLNAVTAVMLDELTDAFRKADHDATVRVVVLTGAGRGFCSGQDLAVAVEAGAGQPGFSYSAYLRAHYDPLILTMRRLTKPIIAAVNGVSAGAGMSIALACDLRVCTDTAFFTQAFVKIGLIPDSGSTWMLPRLIGWGRAMELMLSGRRVLAPEALSIGLVSQVFPVEQFAAEVESLAATYAAAPTQTVSYIKQAATFGLDVDLAAALAQEAALQDLAGASADHHEGVTAFLEKRPANFTGR